MKNLSKILGIAVLAVAIVFTMAACSGKKDSSGGGSSGGSASASSAPVVDISGKIGGIPENRWEKEGESSTYMAFNNNNRQLGYKFAIQGMEMAYLWMWDVDGNTVIIWRFGEVNLLTATPENSAFTFNVALSNGDRTMTVSGLTGEYAGGNGTYNLVD